MPVVETHAIHWKCGHCRQTGTLPLLPGQTIEHVRDAIDRGHDRRSAQCHQSCGIKHVEAIQDGKRLRFGR